MRAWRFCGVCGCRVYGPPAELEAPIAYCVEHGRLVAAAEKLPGDELERLPAITDELEREIARAERDAGGRA